MHQPQRTQIYLPTELRREIDKQRTLSGESLAEYLRKAAKDRLRRERKRKVDLEKLAREVVGAAKGTRSKKEVEMWIKELRRDRELEDKHWLRRTREALKG